MRLSAINDTSEPVGEICVFPNVVQVDYKVGNDIHRSYIGTDLAATFMIIVDTESGYTPVVKYINGTINF